MSSFFPNGTQYAVSTTLAAAIALTAITNADPAVASAAAPPANGSIVMLTSGWSALNDTVAKTGNADADSFELVGVDTTSVADFPAGAGAGTARVAAGWVPLTQVRSDAVTGGDQQFFTYQYLEDKSNRQRQKPTTKSPVVITLQMDYDPALPWYDALVKLDRAGQPAVLRATLPSGDVIYYLAYPSFNKIPTGNMNENQQNTATFSLIGDPVRYEAAA
ncbi:Phage tail tube protein, TTP [Luteibacter sp. UNC138MFCol5.1]|uniref:phage tail protein n=1 Tax=Luteibacter sp. UNC138MFCol5.1 TaxID=1502774 RepID=UPI0008BC7C6C|nr:phage tail protein [Luteibacter sp. UNC138MFCol5.1]SEO63394.1 Phage tail tube protein, TTP [Luteibacter sp. UNC138MFCol5.1]